MVCSRLFLLTYESIQCKYAISYSFFVWPMHLHLEHWRFGLIGLLFTASTSCFAVKMLWSFGNTILNIFSSLVSIIILLSVMVVCRIICIVSITMGWYHVDKDSVYLQQYGLPHISISCLIHKGLCPNNVPCSLSLLHIQKEKLFIKCWRKGLDSLQLNMFPCAYPRTGYCNISLLLCKSTPAVFCCSNSLVLWRAHFRFTVMW